MKKFVLLMIVSILTLSFISCTSHRGCYIFNPGGTLEEVVNTDDGFYQILMQCPVDAVDPVKEYDNETLYAPKVVYVKTSKIQQDVYGSYMNDLYKMSLKDRYELMTVLDRIYRDRMLEERLWHIKRINGLTGEITIEYKW